ncbi:hypothetical protein [Streptomyces sp. B1I3]|uniref:hypothetical protein n=1 Tax=Streptomyces sp. B1I3 TaxID=3042264 RepID=UPI00278ADB1A|nr:hypothetical protein [Streptomyces sp. B1I3]MDQ0791638.1 hypothetical protein [Streptomyces sp. B1I3]
MRITARGPAFGAAVLATVLLAAVTSCSSGSEDGDSGSQLLTGLKTLAGDNSTQQVSFLDVTGVRKLSKGDPKRFSSIAEPSSPLLNPYQPGLLGQRFEVAQIGTAIDTKEAGHWEGSFDAPAITKSLKSKGYTRSEKDGQEVWTHPGDTGVSLQVSADEISYSTRDSDPMAAVNPKDGSSLADNTEYRRAAECLGDVYRADFSPMSSPDPVRLAALGQQASTASENTEVLCFVVADGTAAQDLKAKLQAVVRDESPKFDGTKVTVEKGDQPVVRAVVPDTAAQRPGRLILTDMELWMTAAE